MTISAIEVSKLSKRYSLGATARHRSLIDAIGDYARQIRTGRRATISDFWALREVSFKVMPGETVGLIGENGAGKSTLLKILSRITEPTTGMVRYRGSVGSLLEVGAGFHPQLSGRDNIYLSGALLGMSRVEIRRKFDAIADFSGVESYIDEPVKHYSSGMYVRLAFAVAAFLETEILLVDEVLAVGDAAFQQKCLSRMESIAQEGRTVIFVSHNLTAIQALCRRGIWIKSGQLVQDGNVAQVVASYLGDLAIPATQLSASTFWEQRSSLAGPVRPLTARATAHNDASRPISTATDFVVEWEFDVLVDGAIDQAIIQFYDDAGILLFSQGPWELPQAMMAGRYRTSCLIPGYLLNDRRYYVSLSFTRSGATILELPRALAIDLLDSGEARFGWYGPWPGLLRPKLKWTLEQISRSPIPKSEL